MPVTQSVNDKIAMNVITLAFADRSREEKYREMYRLNSIRTVLTYTPWMAITLTVGIAVLVSTYQILRPLLSLSITLAEKHFLSEPGFIGEQRDASLSKEGGPV